ncbi:spore cortex-lytic enzyme [Abyssisolibacter fermentans]|uniref:spore cortex-lytic enzyme n=1 Tax=Abyssisolibacter fermentans TaxID=1766203 RepID=UPI0008328030|nr:spore cortex-lytic enzyme [Abyssisolibacter fermentans]
MKKLLLITSLAVIVVLSGTIIYMQNQDSVSASQIHLARAMSSRNLYWGARGDDVREVQTKLKKWKYLDGAADGIYGEDTYRAIINFQKKNGLLADGIVGPKTYAALGINIKKPSGSSVNNNDNIYMLARAIHGEARGESYIGKVAVAAVILNRVEHPSFPNTIASVIYQPGAFTAVYDGQINLSPDQESIKAAEDAMNGWDPTYGCRYYWNPATATSSWIWSREVVVKIGKHWFGN